MSVLSFLKRAGKNLGDFSNAVIDRSGGAVVRGGIRTLAFLSEPLPGEQRKAAEDFINKYAENTGEAAVKTGVGRYDPNSDFSKAGRVAGTTINAGAQIFGIDKAAKIAKGAATAASGGSKVLGFLGGSTGALGASAIQQQAQGNSPADALQSLPRGFVQLSNSATGRDTYTPGSKAEKVIFGEDPVMSLQRQYHALIEQGVSPAKAAALTGLSGIGDVLPIIEGARIAGVKHTPLNEVGAIGKNVNGEVPIKIPVRGDTFISVTSDELGNLAKATDANAVKKIIGEALPQNVVDEIAPAIAATQDKNIVSNLLAKGANKVVDTSLPRSDSIIQSVSNPKRVPLAPAGAGSDIVAPRPAPVPSLPPAPRPVLSDINAPQAPTTAPSPVQKVIDALGGKEGQASIEDLQKRQKVMQSVERSRRLAVANAKAAGLSDRDALKAQLSALGGKLPKADTTKLMENLHARINEDDVKQVLSQIQTSPNLQGFDSIKGAKAIVDLFDEGKLPTPSEMKILEKALGEEFVDNLTGTVLESSTKWQRIKDVALQVLGAPKSVMASYDASGLLRQGGVLGSRFPKEFKEAAGEAVGYFKSAKNYEEGLQEIAARPTADLMKKAGLALAGPEGIHEEAFASSIAEKIPIFGKGIEASDRGYSGFLTKLRADAFDHIMTDLTESGVDPSSLSDKALKDIGRFINTASGRGSLGALEKYSTALGDALFSPRLWKSRLDMLNPVYYAKLSPEARKYALQSAGSFAGIAGTVLGLASLAGANIETDARSSDFLKIKVGNTRYDILGGFQQNLVAAWREISGEKKNSMNGTVTKLGEEFGGADRLTILSDLVQNKENPVIATTQTLIRGKDRAGQPVNPVTEIGKLGIPLSAQDIYSATRDTGSLPKGVLKSLPGTVGVSSQTYGTEDLPVSKKQQRAVDRLKESGAPQPEVDANKNFYQTLKTAPSKKNANAVIDEAIAAGDIKRARQLAEEYNKRYADSFKEWVEKYGDYSNADLVKAYNGGKIKLTATTIKKRAQAAKEK